MTFCQLLEPRRLLAASFSLSDGVLTIKGTSNDEFGGASLVAGGFINASIGDAFDQFRANRVDKIVVKAGGGDDEISLVGVEDIPCSVRGGDGNDTLSGANGNDTIRGDDGKDQIDPRSGNDKVYGDEGNDSFIDNLRFTSPGFSGKDIFIGGDGRDEISYYARSANLRISLDGEANDGEDGEKDNVMPDVEVVIGGGGDDRIYGNSRDNRLYGGGGHDRIDAKGGNDRLYADLPQGTGFGNDTLLGGDGDDILYANDSTADTVNGGDGEDKALLGPGGDPGLDRSLNNETEKYYDF